MRRRLGWAAGIICVFAAAFGLTSFILDRQDREKRAERELVAELAAAAGTPRGRQSPEQERLQRYVQRLSRATVNDHATIAAAAEAAELQRASPMGVIEELRKTDATTMTVGGWVLPPDARTAVRVVAFSEGKAVADLALTFKRPEIAENFKRPDLTAVPIGFSGPIRASCGSAVIAIAVASNANYSVLIDEGARREGCQVIK